MAERIDPNLHRELKTFGAGDLDICYSCGTCTAICPLSDENSSFPRHVIHMAQVGLKERLQKSIEPWMCYYCGDCSDSCPREANPAETMMAARRYLTASYDWTGISKKLYLSGAAEVAAVVLVGVIIGLLFLFLHGPVVTDRVELNTFAPVKWIELGDLIMAAILSFFLLSNALRMMYWFIGKDKDLHVPLSAYILEAKTMLVNFFTQKRWRGCSEDHTRWLKHLLLVSGYLTMLTLVLILLRWFQTDKIYPIYHPQRLLGYYATIVLLYFTVDFMIGRRKKKERIHEFSHASDWMFLVLLFLTALTGIMVNIFRISGLPLATYIIYVIHLMIAVPMLVVEVPFGKWAHLFYRPFALYLVAVKDRAKAMEKARSKKKAVAAA
ncbi:MAG: 4Fe-4S dicluster domain-containing protein [Deltaproteobacteria bacterium]|nr:4Fe-4S dicluster domain-containing protein [Deltaproteobacteria bacterium]